MPGKKKVLGFIKMKIKPKENIRYIGDENGNKLICSNNGNRIIVSLKLLSEVRSRNLGTINLSSRVIKIKRNSKKHLMRSVNGYGFNHRLLADSKLFDTICLSDENSNWQIPKQFILDNGVFLNFNKQGFELQVFIRLYNIEQFKKNTII